MNFGKSAWIGALAIFVSCSLVGCDQRSPTKTVTAFLDAAISHGDPSDFLAPGADATSVTGHEATSYEIKNASGDLVSTVVHFKGTETHYTERNGTRYTNPMDNTTIDMPEAIRFRVKDGKITEVF